jgi:hypothetical protein
MATSPSEPPSFRFDIVGGGAPTAEEVAAIAAALEVVLGAEPAPPPLNRWRWSGRWWHDDRSDWRRSRPPTHPSQP